MIVGAHSIVYSKDPEADRAFFRDVLGLPHVDAGDGWLIFGLPPSEVAVHPSDENDVHGLYLLCDSVEAFVRAMKARHVTCGPVLNRGWGLLTQVALPGGGRLGVYEPRHARPGMAGARRRARAGPRKRGTRPATGSTRRRR
jgi:catechol 2,3-dioxygenase-like lactoylglutathione lyase family enzyme